MVRPKWMINLIKRAFPRRFFLARFTKIPGIGKLTDLLLFNNDEIYFLPQENKKVLQTQKIIVVKEIPHTDEFVLPSQIVDFFIEKANYHWIMNSCLCRSAEKCENYPIDLGCLFLGEAAERIDPTLGRKVTKEEAKEHVKKCREAGLVHLIGRNKLDTQWLDVRPGTKLMTICSCCECCCLWKMLPKLNKKIARKINRMPGLEITINDNCKFCLTCLNDVCFVEAIKFKENKVSIDSSICRGCGRCLTVCSNNAITLHISDEGFINETLNRITELVDVT